MMRYCVSFLSCALLFSCFFSGVTVSWAAAPADVLRQQEQILQQQEERRRALEEEKRLKRDAPPEALPMRQLPATPVPEGAACVQVDNISISGVTLLSSSALEEITDKYVKRCLPLVEINNLLREITNAYIERGYIATRVFVDPSQTTAGELKLMVVEGMVEGIRLNQGGYTEDYQVKVLFPGVVGEPLNLRDIEQGLDQINRLPSNNATVELLPGQNQGGTIVQINNPEKRTWRVGVGLDNLGQRATGQHQYQLSLEKDNYIGLMDQWSVYWSQDAPFLRELAGKENYHGNNQSLSVLNSFPAGYWTFSNHLSVYKYNTTIHSLTNDYESSGETLYFRTSAERVIHRDAISKTSVGVFLALRNVDSYFESIKLEVSSYRLSTFGLSLSHSRRIWGGSLSLHGEYGHGTTLFGATKEEEKGHFVPERLYQKLSANIRWYRPFELWEKNFFWSLSAYGQCTSSGTLRGAERLQIGSRNSVRGFHEDSLSGDQGAYVRNDLGISLPLPDFLSKSGFIHTAQVYVGYDYGFIHKDRHDVYERGSLQGVSAGLRLYGDLILDLCVAKEIDHPSWMKSRDYEVYASLNYTF